MFLDQRGWKKVPEHIGRAEEGDRKVEDGTRGGEEESGGGPTPQQARSRCHGDIREDAGEWMFKFCTIYRSRVTNGSCIGSSECFSFVVDQLFFLLLVRVRVRVSTNRSWKRR